jgi:hypothetical protein
VSTAVMPARIAEGSPRVKAKISGVVYFLVFVTGVFGFSVGGRYVVSNDATATAANILAHESLFRLGLASSLIATALYIAVTALFYDLFKPANRSVSLLAAFFSLVGCATGGVSFLLLLAPLVLLKGAQYLSVFNVEQLQALALACLKLAGEANNIGLVFFGVYCLLIGYLIFKSNFLPRILGAAMTFAGLGWLTGSFASFLSPPLIKVLFPYIMWPGMLGEASLTVWLLVKGVNVQRWKEQVSAARESLT